MEDGFDVVAVGVAHERAEVAGVVLRPQPRRVQRLGARFQRGVVEGLHGVDVWGLEREVHLTVGPGRVTGVHVGDPEVGLAVVAVADGDLVVQLPGVSEHTEDLVVEGLGPRPSPHS